ncbi:hypothetical protein [Bradyrhizobium sp.]|uniref:hypothetical protein n=1 Tax=Bradyrhizobium sp. TaxID=376 RepID=UPI003C5C42EF
MENPAEKSFAPRNEMAATGLGYSVRAERFHIRRFFCSLLALALSQSFYAEDRRPMTGFGSATAGGIDD